MLFNRQKEIKRYEVQKTGRGRQFTTVKVKAEKGSYSVRVELEAGDVFEADPKTVVGLLQSKKLEGGAELKARLKETTKATTYPKTITEEELLACEGQIDKLKALKGKSELDKPEGKKDKKDEKAA